MFNINSPVDCKIAYSILRDEDFMHHAKPEKIEELKRNLRQYLNKPINEERRCVYEDNYGYYVMLVRLPEFLKSVEDAEEYFDEFERLEYIPSPYDCTGQHFTTGHKIFKRRGRFYVYHSIAIDC